MARFLSIAALLLTLAGCSDSEFGLAAIRGGELDLKTTTEIDLLIVLDTSCSMAMDWPIITYGLAASVDALALDMEVTGRVTTACPDDTVLYPANSGWELVTAIPRVRREGCSEEAGLEASLVKRDLDFYSDGRRAAAWTDAPDVIVFVSDEADQSAITSDDFLDNWQPYPDWITAVVGPDEDGGPSGPACSYDLGTGYLDVADKVVSVCTTQPWTLF